MSFIYFLNKNKHVHVNLECFFNSEFSSQYINFNLLKSGSIANPSTDSGHEWSD